MTIYIKSRKHGAVGRLLNLQASIAISTLALAAPLNASAQQGEGNLPSVEVKERNESYKAERISSPKFTQPLVDSTQTINVIKKELLRRR
ncbi:hypothetical protein [Herbaspirillum sp. RV1423]|uniref:hypothetical protein n=1 Tax=Herbaspirillum sp. RV1423 TaxID=1443993 RepID=UPI0004B9E769|nr:hypothetical protein [Herbaspirillum sp. RV1423]